MAFLLRPSVFTPAYCGPTACYAPSRPSRSYARPSFVPFLSQVDDLVNELHREARRAARKEEERRRILNPRFDVKETEEGYQVDGEVPGFEQENIEIEVSDEYTLAIKANTEKKTEAPAAAPVEEKLESEMMDGVTITETEIADDKSDAGSHKSYQATVEDDFEDLGAETSSTLSARSDASSKGKEKAVEEPTATPAATEAPAQQPQEQQQELKEKNWLNERVRGSFVRTFRFPSRIDGAATRASLRNGVLSITVPKAPVPEIRNILIQ